MDAYFVVEHAGGQEHSAPEEWTKVKVESIGLTESNKSEALAKHRSPSQSQVDKLF